MEFFEQHVSSGSGYDAKTFLTWELYSTLSHSLLLVCWKLYAFGFTSCIPVCLAVQYMGYGLCF